MNDIVLLSIAAVGTVSSTVFLCLVVIAALRFRREARGKLSQALHAGAVLPPVSVFKPLHGAEPRLLQNLESFFRQDYPSAFEIIFAARRADDEGLTLAAQLAAKFPNVPTKFVATGEPPWPNAKVYALSRMQENAAYDHFVISDSDVHVAPDYLRNVVAPMLDDNVGVVTCVYRGRQTGGIWSKFEALGMSVEMSSGVMVADMLEGMKFALGPSMTVSRECLAAIGGLEALGDYCADDFVLGALAAKTGYRVALSHFIIDHCALHRNFGDSIAHQVRWMRSTRFSRPAGHLGTGLTFAAPFAVLAGIAAPLSDFPEAFAGLAAWNLINPVIQSVVMGRVLRDSQPLRFAWLYPIRNMLGFAYWLSSYTSSRIEWRNEIYELFADGRMRLKFRPQPKNKPETTFASD